LEKEKEVNLHPAIFPDWYWAITQTKPEIAWIAKDRKCLVKLVDGVIADIEPWLDASDLNIIQAIMTANLNYS
jgi:hypothetical protein